MVDHRPLRKGGCLAYYTLVSSTPLIIILISIVGMSFGNADVHIIWRDVAIGAAATSALFSTGKLLED